MVRLTKAQIDEFESKARNSRDNARAEELVSASVKDEYLAGISGSPTANKETNARSMELYDFYIGGQRRAKQYTTDAELFEAAAAMGRQALEAHHEQ